MEISSLRLIVVLFELLATLPPMISSGTAPFRLFVNIHTLLEDRKLTLSTARWLSLFPSLTIAIGV